MTAERGGFPISSSEQSAPATISQRGATGDSVTLFADQARVQDLVEARAKAVPEALAIEASGVTLTYGQLDERANRLAHELVARGVGADTVVAICIGRSVEALVGILGILKAGGAYAPLDPTQPAELTAWILENLGDPVLLTEDRFARRFASHLKALVRLDADWPEISRRSRERPECPAGPDHLAYVIHTSGSTGRPKGVLVSHRNLLASTAARFAYYTDRVGRFLLVSSFAYDSSVAGIFWTLAQGGLLYVPDEETRRDPARLARVIARDRITHLLSVPSLYSAILAEPGPRPIESLRTVIVAGEPCPAALLPAHAAAAPQSVLYNEYGPTETTVWSTVYRCPAQVSGSSVPIGQPIANAQVYLLDENRAPASTGTPGEIFIGGQGVARGYWKDSTLTAERFVANPYGEGSSRLYRTGDLGRYLPSGEIEFLGRSDQQVKIRGVRVEPGEIEAVLETHPQVRQAVVVAREAVGGGKSLIAYAVPERGPRPTVEQLRRFLRDRLPSPSVPAAVILVDSIPLTPAGKLDRGALRERAVARPVLSEPLVGPSSATEEILAAIWEDLLGMPEIGVRDDFFELGGDSLLATRVMSRIRDAFGLELPLGRLFEASTVSRLAREVEQARSASALVSESLRLRPVPRQGELPLSFAQQRLWFLHQMDPEDPVYNVPAAFRLTGTLDVAALERSLREVLSRHEALRTAYPALEGRAFQIVTSGEPAQLVIQDFRDLPEPEKTEHVARAMREEAVRPFDLAGRPILRARLLCLAERENVLLLTTHHIAADDWSLGVFYRELSVCYSTFSAGARTAPALPALPLQYADYAVCQREWLGGANLDRLLDYWTSRLTGIPSILELPTDFPRKLVRSSRGASTSARLSANLTRELRRLTRRGNVTLFMTLLAAFQTLLHRYTGQTDIVVGSPIAGRTRSETEGLIGFFVNTLVMRSNFAGDPTFRVLLERVRETALGAYAHQDLPFEKLVEELKPERSLSHTPLFQAMFVLQNAPEQPLELPGVAVRPLTVDTGTAKFDLTLFVAEEGDELRCTLEYSTELFEPATIRRMLHHFRNLLEGIVVDPDRPVAALPMLTGEERQRMLVEWNSTWSEFPSARCVHELFEDQARRTPAAPAVVDGAGRVVSYSELARMAGDLAHRLRAMGVRLEDRVGVFLGRTPEMVASLIAVMKAGAAYVPLDPSAPRERLLYILEDSATEIVITDAANAPGLAETEARLLYVDEEPDTDSSAIPEIANGGAASPESLAYVMYTSGSTGRPKGVMIEHRSLVNYLCWAAGAYGMDEGAGALLHSSIAFDLTVTSLFAPLLAGRSVTLVPQNGEAEALGHALRRQSDLTLVKLVPSQLEILERQINSEELSDRVRSVVLGGEALAAESIATWRKAAPLTRFFNEYGPTEATVGCCVYKLPQEGMRGPVPIGRPIANTRAYVLNTHLQPVPVRVAGELFIGGTGVARGYWDRPDLTAEKFLPDPFDPERGSVYRSGDLVRYLPDGNLEFLGRLDHQVKIRGFRIELEEVEAAIEEHPAVRDAAVAAREDVPGDRRLVAYVVWRAGQALRNGELRRFLQTRLPDYMIPSAVVSLDTLPLGASDKLDRSALPAPSGERSGDDGLIVAPRDAFEQQLKMIWEKVLNVRPVGMRDNFFNLGGHSLLAVRLFAEIEKVAGRKVPLATIFQAPNVEALAAILRQSDWLPSWDSLVAIQPGGARLPLYCVHGFGGNVVGYNLLAQHLGPDQPVYGLQSRGLDGRQPPLATVEEMAAHYLTEIRAFQPDGPYLLSGLSFGGVVAYEMALQLTAQGFEVALLALFDTYPPENAPPESARKDAKWRSYGERIRLHAGRLVRGPDRWGYVRRKLRTLSRRGGSRLWYLAYELSIRIGTPLPRALRRLAEANLAAVRLYRPGAWEGRLTLFRALAPVVGVRYDPVAAWEELALGGVDTVSVPGDHVSILEEPNVEVLAERLRDAMGSATQELAAARSERRAAAG